MPDVLALESQIRQVAPEYAAKFKAAAEATPGQEANFRSRASKLIDAFAQAYDLDIRANEEYTLINGRADAVYNRLVIEYEPPGSLRARACRANDHAVEQVKKYLDGLVRRERHKPERLAGVAWDGLFFIFVLHSDTGWRVEDPVPVEETSSARFLSLLASLRLERALLPKYLIEDFGENTEVSRKAVSTLYSVLKATEVPLVKKLFEQWSLQFGEVCDYEEASKLDLSEVARKFNIRESKVDSFRFFFCMHTYYATFIKLLAVQIAQFYLAPKLGTNLRQVASYDPARLKSYMEKMERGGVLKDFGIANFLEGDFFKWYLEAWDQGIYEAFKGIIASLANYSLVTLDVNPNVTKDILKVLYQGLVPKKLRHNLGEYYTPDWLAERLLRMVVGDVLPLDKRVLDPACGSGTFLVLAIKKMKEFGLAKRLPESEILTRILSNVVGFDLNPLAVISARTNYLLALGDLLEHRKEDISIPVYLCDSVVTPREGSDFFGKDRFKVPSAVGDFVLPKSMIKANLIDRLADVLEELVGLDFTREEFDQRMTHEFPLMPDRDRADLDVLWELYEKLLGLKRDQVNGIWARIIKNAFAPIFEGEFDYVVGNPPWINWESLPETYRKDSKHLWQHYGLFVHSGMDVMLGKGKKDISTLMTYVVADKNLKMGGKLGFLITQSVFKTDAGRGFRRFELPQKVPLGVVHVDDISAFQPFEGAANRTAAFVLQKGRNTEYGDFKYWVWLKKKEKLGSLPMGASLKEIQERVDFNQFVAEPVDLKDLYSQWITGRPKMLKAIRKIMGRSGYHAHEGVNSGGANAIYWVEIVGKRPDGLVVISNITEGAKRKVESIQKPMEKGLLFPLLRGRDVRRWHAEPSAMIIMSQDPIKRVGLPELIMKSTYIETYKYLKYFEKDLHDRAAFRRYFTRRDKDGKIIETGPFYSMFDVGVYTFKPWKIVWREQAASLTVAVVGKKDGKPIIPDHKLMLVDCSSSDEAHFLSAVLNSTLSMFVSASYAVSIQHGTHILENINVPKFDGNDKRHLALSNLSEQAHDAVAKGDEEKVKKIEAQVDVLAADVWGLSEAELKEIKKALEELK